MYFILTCTEHTCTCIYFAGYIGCVCSYMCNFFQGVKVDPKNAEGMGGLVWADQRATLTGGWVLVYINSVPCLHALHSYIRVMRSHVLHVVCSTCIRPVCVCMLLMTIFTMVCFQYMNFTMKIVHKVCVLVHLPVNIIMIVRFWHCKNMSSLWTAYIPQCIIL